MSQDEERTRRSRVVVETPTARREVVQSQTVRYPEERRGFSTGMVAAVALTAIALTVIIFLFLSNPSDDSANTNINVRTAGAAQPTPFTQQPVIVQQPVTQPTPIIIQQAPMPQQPPVIIQQAPPPTTTTVPSTTTAPAPSGVDDMTLQSKVDKAYKDDSEIASTDVMGMVIDGKVTLTGTVNSAALKQKAERLARAVRGISSVENKITVSN
ncbi:MAG: BON domain-containing protein [Acidobacteria bacterium]|nr:BON domain-containing protein [Acidobacteriota bacterium]